MPQNIKKKIKQARTRNYLSKDFDSFRFALLDYARTYFPTKINDFTEASLGGLLLDMAATIGDTLSFYLDHQFSELNPRTAVETDNITMHLHNAGVPITGASPAVVTCRFSIEVLATINTLGESQPQPDLLPVIQAGTVLEGNNGISYNLVDDLDYSKVNYLGELRAVSEISAVNNNGIPTKYRLYLDGVCISGTETTHGETISAGHIPFREITLPSSNISDIISVIDTEGNKYYEVGALSQDVVFGGTPTIGRDGELVEQEIEVIPAPYRFTRTVEPLTKMTVLQFGSGHAQTLDDDIVPDPSELALPLYGRKTFSRFVIDPNSLLGTQTLGIAPSNTILSIKYRYGGGLSHNCASQTIRTPVALGMLFDSRPNSSEATDVRNSLDVINPHPAVGGLPAPTLNELRAKIPASRSMQSRIVSKADMIARIYTLPSKFGRVFRAAMSPNPNNPLSSNLYVLCMDQDGLLTVAPDPLKKNLRKYLNEYRLISDAVDVLDARVLNFGVDFSIVCHPHANKRFVIQKVIQALSNILTIENFQINQPIVLSDLVNVIINTDGVISLVKLPRIVSQWGTVDGRVYSNSTFNVKNLETRGLVVPPFGSIFEMRYPATDIVGNAA